MIYGTIVNKELKDMKTISPQAFNDTNCVVLYDDKRQIIFLWIGQKANSKSKMLAEKLVFLINKEVFGGVAQIIKDQKLIKNLINKHNNEPIERIPEKLKLFLKK